MDINIQFSNGLYTVSACLKYIYCQNGTCQKKEEWNSKTGTIMLFVY